MAEIFKNLTKYIGSCCGNSFLIVDCRGKNITSELKSNYSKDTIPKLRVDTALFLNDSEGFSTSIDVFEKDGSESDSCGNGMLLITQLLNIKEGVLKMKKDTVTVFSESDKVYLLMRLELGTIAGMDASNKSFLVRMGEPHLIFFVENIFEKNLQLIGSQVQKDYPEGVNVDLVERLSEKKYLIRTYERGVFNETKSCGTGSLSSYLAISFINNKINLEPIEIVSDGGVHWVSRVGNRLKLETLKEFCKIYNLS